MSGVGFLFRKDTGTKIPRYRHVPNDAELTALPIVHPGEFELNDKEVRQLRSRVYALNKDNALYRFRTMKDGSLLLVWRLEK